MSVLEASGLGTGMAVLPSHLARKQQSNQPSLNKQKRQGRPPRCSSTTPTTSKSFFQMVTSSGEKDSNSQTKSKKQRISPLSSQDETHSPFEVLDEDSFSQASFSAIIPSTISYAEILEQK